MINFIVGFFLCSILLHYFLYTAYGKIAFCVKSSTSGQTWAALPSYSRDSSMCKVYDALSCSNSDLRRIQIFYVNCLLIFGMQSKSYSFGRHCSVGEGNTPCIAIMYVFDYQVLLCDADKTRYFFNTCKNSNPRFTGETSTITRCSRSK